MLSRAKQEKKFYNLWPWTQTPTTDFLVMRVLGPKQMPLMGLWSLLVTKVDTSKTWHHLTLMFYMRLQCRYKR